MKLNYTYLAKMLIDGNKSEAILLWIICNIEIDLVHLYPVCQTPANFPRWAKAVAIFWFIQSNSDSQYIS